MDKLAKKATELAENELQEREIKHLKNIIQSLLQKKLDKEKEREKLDEEIKLIKQDIDDFKSGRLDKIKERHDLDPRANDIHPIQIRIISQTVPIRPWCWQYAIGNGTVVSGTTSATYSSGSYAVLSSNGTSIINL